MNRMMIEDIKRGIRSHLNVKSLKRVALFCNAGLSRPEEFEIALQEMLNSGEIRLEEVDPTGKQPELRYYLTDLE